MPTHHWMFNCVGHIYNDYVTRSVHRRASSVTLSRKAFDSRTHCWNTFSNPFFRKLSSQRNSKFATMISYHSAIVRILNGLFIEVRAPQSNFCSGVGRLYTYEVLQVILVWSEDVCKIDKVRRLDLAGCAVYWNVMLDTSNLVLVTLRVEQHTFLQVATVLLM